jgi:DnaK suppressor protein
MAKKVKRHAKKTVRKIMKRSKPRKAVRVKRGQKAKKMTLPKGKRFARMPKKDIKIYKALLIKERETIGGDMSHIAKETLNRSQKDASGDLSGYSFHMADAASDNYEVEFSLGRATDEQKILYLVDEALGRVKDGTYGCCQQCSKQIAKNRLRALPHVELCIECQKANEAK